jgi:hypothetical protein
MRNGQHTLLAGIAALAFFAASGIAAAQQTQQGAGSAAQSSSNRASAANRAPIIKAGINLPIRT